MRHLIEGPGLLLALMVTAIACAPTQQDINAQDQRHKVDRPAEAPEQSQAAPPPAPTCTPYAPGEQWPSLSPRDGLEAPLITICPTEETMAALMASRRREEPPQPNPPTLFQDPLSPGSGGMAIYDRAIHGTARMAHTVPLIFFSTPPMSQAQIDLLDADPKLLAQAQSIWGAKGPKLQWRKIKILMKIHKRDKARLRAILLRDGFVFYEDPLVARKIFHHLTLRHLFDEDEIFLRRGDVIHRLEKTRFSYVHAEGRLEGDKARLLIFDRVSASRDDLLQRRAWDLRAVRHSLGLRAFEVQSTTADLVTASAVPWEGPRIPAALFLNEGGRHVLALRVAEADQPALVARLDADRRDAAFMQGVMRAGETMVSERLRFDEPRTEEGQQDGMLRIMWNHAYKRGMNTYTFNGDRYTVFTQDGQPNVPQVCIDFVLDSAERWSGAWWHPKDQPRGRTEGFLDFKRLLGNERQVRRLVEYAGKNPDKMDLLSYPDGGRVPYMRQAPFYERIESWASDTRVGDIVVIWGLRGDGRNHWHAFYVFDTDPVYNIPYLLIGNAGYAKVTTWHDTMRTAPRRAVVNRIRLRTDWLSSLRSP